LLLVSGERVDVNTDLDLDILAPVFFGAAAKVGGRRITVVLEVERGTTSDGVLYMVKSAAKKLARGANVIVVLSEANAALMFGDDKRQEFVWVDGMTQVEASTFAKKMLPAVPDRDLEMFFDKVRHFQPGRKGLRNTCSKTSHIVLLHLRWVQVPWTSWPS
jgi:hypothetical protein